MRATRAAATAALSVAMAPAAALAGGRLLDAAVGRAERRLNRVTVPLAAPPSERARAIHASLRLADLHADSLLWGRDLLRRGSQGHVDIPRLIDGGVAIEVLSMPVAVPARRDIERSEDRNDQVRLIALARRWPRATWRRRLPRVQHLVAQAERLEAASGGTFRLLRSRDDLGRYLEDREAGRPMTAALLSIEGAHALDDDPANVDVVADLGIRMISPAHFFDTAFGGSAHGLERYGLTRRGREMVRRMEARSIILDLAHASARTIDDALAVSTRPVVASHTGVRGVCDNARNLSDAQLEGIAATGGLVGIGFWETAAGGPDVGWIARSIAYAVDRIGLERVALGSDWDGAVAVPFDAAGIVRLTAALLDIGLDEDAIRAVMGENVIRLFERALP